MKNALLALFVVPLLTVPAFAGSSTAGDKPIIVAEDVGVEVGNVGVGVGGAVEESQDQQPGYPGGSAFAGLCAGVHPGYGRDLPGGLQPAQSPYA